MCKVAANRSGVVHRSQFKCANESKCIPRWWECDGRQDCLDKSDEHKNCGMNSSINASCHFSRYVGDTSKTELGPEHLFRLNKQQELTALGIIVTFLAFTNKGN